MCCDYCFTTLIIIVTVSLCFGPSPLWYICPFYRVIWASFYLWGQCLGNWSPNLQLGLLVVTTKMYKLLEIVLSYIQLHSVSYFLKSVFQCLVSQFEERNKLSMVGPSAAFIATRYVLLIARKKPSDLLCTMFSLLPPFLFCSISRLLTNAHDDASPSSCAASVQWEAYDSGGLQPCWLLGGKVALPRYCTEEWRTLRSFGIPSWADLICLSHLTPWKNLDPWIITELHLLMCLALPSRVPFSAVLLQEQCPIVCMQH